MKMDMETFAERISTAVGEKMGSGFRTEVREVRKNNGIRLHGLLIREEGKAVVPAIYLECFLKAYESGTPFEEVVCRLLSVYRRDVPPDDISMDFFGSFGAVKKRVCYRLIGRKGNEDLLGEIPHVDFLDMAICFYYAYHGEAFGDGSILVCNSHAEMWDTCTEELLRLARGNTPRLFPGECCGMDEVLRETAGTGGDACGFPQKDGTGDACMEVPMKILSNRQRVFGAVCILYPGLLEGIAEKEGNLYIIPSSIHETILLPDDGRHPAMELKKMVYEVNRTQVIPEEVLTDRLYYYDAARKEIVMA